MEKRRWFILAFILLFSVVFFEISQVSSAGKSPQLVKIDKEMIACENSIFEYALSASDPDEEILTFDIYPKELFFVDNLNDNSSGAKIISSNITKKYAQKNFKRTIYVSDGEKLDYADTLIKVVEVNNPPVIENIGIKTISLETNKNFFEKVEVYDIEDGDSGSEKIKFETVFLNGGKIFSVDKKGEINYTANELDIGNYEVQICAIDSGLPKLSKESHLCNENGSSLKVCESFLLTITDRNRAPTIVSQSPQSENVTILKSQKINFNISSFDPDGSIPDVAWFLDGVLIPEESRKSAESLVLEFQCSNNSKTHEVKAQITDSLLSDSVFWNINFDKNCTSQPTQIKSEQCQTLWGCSEWYFCQNTEKSRSSGIIAGEDYELIKQECASNSFSTDLCGFQIRNCFSLNNCTSLLDKQEEIRMCEFTLNPSCSDGIRNCHSSGCEFLTDCGGPCPQCGSCSDGVKNQDEAGVDCGGSCLASCEKIERRKLGINVLGYTIVIVTLFLVIFFGIILYKMIRTNRELKKYKEQITPGYIEKNEVKI